MTTTVAAKKGHDPKKSEAKKRLPSTKIIVFVYRHCVFCHRVDGRTEETIQINYYWQIIIARLFFPSHLDLYARLASDIVRFVMIQKLVICLIDVTILVQVLSQLLLIDNGLE